MKKVRIGAISLLLAAGVIAPGGASADSCIPPPPKPLRFRSPVFIDQHRGGGEPVSVVANDGSIIVGAHTGDTHLYLRTIPEVEWYATYRHQSFIWRSTDGGQTWKRVEFLLPGSAMHSPPSSIGPSDPDFGKDSAGNLYETELEWNVSVAASHDNGQTWPDANPLADIGDRPWVVGRGPNEVYLRITGNFQKSTDGGKTWA